MINFWVIWTNNNNIMSQPCNRKNPIFSNFKNIAEMKMLHDHFLDWYNLKKKSYLENLYVLVLEIFIILHYAFIINVTNA